MVNEANKRLPCEGESFSQIAHSLELSNHLMGSSLYANEETKNKMGSCQTFPTSLVLHFRDGSRQLSMLLPPPLFDKHVFKLCLLQ